MNLYCFLAMVFFHILDDFCLQSLWLVNGKQKGWWEQNAPDPLYKHDYLVALFMHSVSWAFMISIPLVVYLEGDLTAWFYGMFAINTALHMYVDNLKANRHAINLIQDQIVHLLQIALTMSVVGVYRT